MLVITRAVFDMVQIPGQQPLVVARDTGDEAARQWWDEHVRAVAAACSSAEQRELGTSELADWQAATEVAGGQRTAARRRAPGGGGPDHVSRTAPTAVVDPAAAHDYITEEFRARFPQPTVAAQFADWRETVQIAELRTWAGWLYQAGSGCRWTSGCRLAEFGYPIREVLGCLDRLAADGWQIVHVSEDRAGHHAAGRRADRLRTASARRATCSAGPG